MKVVQAMMYTIAGVIVICFASLAVGSGMPISEQRRARTVLSNAVQSCAVAAQNTNPVLCIMYAEHGLASADTLRRLYGDSELRLRCGVDVGEIVQICSETRRRGLRKLKKSAPRVAVRGDLGAVL